MISRLSSALATLLLALSASAQSTIEANSFGHNRPISRDGRTIPGWHLSGENHIPQLLSDRIILTPPAPGSARGALWSESPTLQPEWSTTLTFRASGQERGSGNLQLWFAKDGRLAISQSSIYTIGTFDGFALVIDQYGSNAGSVRGFLNDGTTSYRDHHSVDSLAFAHCDFAYRNLGTPSAIRIENSAVAGLRVSIDGTTCFASANVNLPSGYFFGLTAATAENPDSFEISSFVVTSASSSVASSEEDQQRQASSPPRTPQQQQQQQQDPSSSSSSASADQIAAINTKLEALTSILESLVATTSSNHNLLVERIPESNSDALAALSRRLESVERTVQTIQRDVEGRDYGGHLRDLQNAVEGVRGGLTEHLPDRISQSKTFSIFPPLSLSFRFPFLSDTFSNTVISTSAPKMGMFIFVVIAFQVMLVGAYIVYKKRRANAPKKYL